VIAPKSGIVNRKHRYGKTICGFRTMVGKPMTGRRRLEMLDTSAIVVVMKFEEYSRRQKCMERKNEKETVKITVN